MMMNGHIALSAIQIWAYEEEERNKCTHILKAILPSFSLIEFVRVRFKDLTLPQRTSSHTIFEGERRI